MVSARRPTILVVDDEPDVVATATAFFEDMAKEVLSAYDGESALALALSRDDIDVVLTDIRMPGMSGTEFAARLRQTRPGLPVVLTSAYVDAPPGLPFVPKPWRREGLRAVIRRIVDP